MLVENDKHKRLHTLGPKDCVWGNRDQGVTMINVTRQTIADEQMSFSMPVFEQDTRESLSDRLGMLLSVVQDRIEEANEAWLEIQAKNDKEKREGRLKNLQGK